MREARHGRQRHNRIFVLQGIICGGSSDRRPLMKSLKVLEGDGEPFFSVNLSLSSRYTDAEGTRHARKAQGQNWNQS